jgi:hypothetical protein
MKNLLVFREVAQSLCSAGNRLPVLNFTYKQPFRACQQVFAEMRIFAPVRPLREEAYLDGSGFTTTKKSGCWMRSAQKNDAARSPQAPSSSRRVDSQHLSPKVLRQPRVVRPTRLSNGCGQSTSSGQTAGSLQLDLFVSTR